MTVTNQPYKVSLNNWAILSLTGKDAKPLLQGQITINMDDITPEQGKLSGYCNLKGRLHGMFYVLEASPFEDGYWLVMPSSIIEHIEKTLTQYARFSKVKITNITNEYNLMGLSNIQAIDVPPSSAFKKSYLNALSSMVFYVPENRAIMISEKSTDPLSNLEEAQPESWQAEDIRAGLPWIYDKTIESFLPHYLNLNQFGSLNFNKGCYLGQEIIARMEYKGNIKRHLYRVTLNKEKQVPAATELLLHDGGSVGTILYSVDSPNGAQGLATIQDDATKRQLKLNYGKETSIKNLELITEFY